VTQRVPQLRMGFRRFDALPELRPVPGHALRTFHPGDEDGWIALLSTGGWDPWDRPRLDGMLAGAGANLPHEGIFFATHDDRIVGAACVFLQCDGAAAAELGWVVVDPAHRGRGLARLICVAALRFVRDRGCPYAFLNTEDFRVPAVRLYLDLGFEPEMVDPSHPAWWAALRGM
jgi:mycothiol synthase